MSRDDGIWVGIDVSKDSLDVGALPSGQVWSVPNDEAGVDRLLAEFGPSRPTLIVMEATGGYEMLPSPEAGGKREGRGTRGLGPYLVSLRAQ